MVILYTIDCPACRVLERKMAAKGITFETVKDEDVLKEKGLTVFPVLELENGAQLSLREAVEWVNQQEAK